MLRVLRQCRVLALALLLAAPGLGGTWLSVAHPCPVDLPWLAEAGHQGHGAQTSHGHGDAPDGSSTSCNCVGACQASGAALVSTSTVPTAVLAVDGWNTSPSSPDIEAPAAPRLRRHPPATAPPLA